MNCPICGYESGDKDKSCGKCGTDFSLFATKGEVDEVQILSIKGGVKKNRNKPNKPNRR